ncbi:MAG TPA: TadE/TadG family type IV pilus assembly protein [Terracidiphilus sp.]|nr:TadE/TadG family type IV pilus assembly protein [Terracidiphilus sp.]
MGQQAAKEPLQKIRAGMQKLFRLSRREHGSALVEFAMSALILMGILVGVTEFAVAMYAYHFLSSAAQQGTRFAMVRGSTWSEYETDNCSTSAPPNFTMPYDCTASSTDIQNYVQSLATPGISPGSVTVSATWPGLTPDGTSCATANSQGCLVKVKVSYSFQFLPFQNLSAMSLSATSEGVILQ